MMKTQGRKKLILKSVIMKKFITKNLTALALAAALAFTVPFCQTVSANEHVENGLVLSADALTLTEGASAVLAAALPEGFDASRLACVSADPNVAAAAPAASMDNIANFLITYVGSGSTVVAVYHLDNPAIVAYITVSASPIVMDIPARLGTNHDNYCTLTSYEFVPYDFQKYADFHDYKYTMNLRYTCSAYEDDGYTKWGCYGYFYDAAGTVLSKVHLYCSSLSKNRTYHSEFHVPVNAVRFSVEGF